ncbi:MAG: sigma-70 family RNA polymerase sigma factor [Flavobacteriaceae bacterium]|nr:sigma-70 family RNA polymerase sigma factor [Flavobacteriaceae bacterium]
MSTHKIEADKWVDRYSDYLYNYTIVRVNDHIIAQDLISETFLAGLQSKKNFKGEASERTWLISILKRKIIDHYRRSNSKKGKSEVRMSYASDQSEGDWLEERIGDEGNKNIDALLENEELGLAILECLDQLQPRHAAIFKMKTIQDFDTETICNEFKITPSNLWVIIHRARTTLANCLEKNWLQ